MTRFIKILFAVALALFPALHCQAETVSRKEASKIAATFFNTAYRKATGKPDMVYNGKNLTTDRLFSPFYVFNSPAGGFVIVSAENKAFPILGYRLKEKFNPNAIDATEKAIFSEYARQIEYIRYDSRIPFEAIEAWTALDNHIGDILKTPDGILMRPHAVEFPDVGLPAPSSASEEDEADYPPFAFYEEFLAATRAENEERLRIYDEILNPSTPVISQIGGGHFEIRFPEEITLGRIFNLHGAIVESLTFKNTDTALFTLDREPPGFYVALVAGKSGKSYGIKLYK